MDQRKITFGENLKRFRKAASMTRRTLAQAIGYSEKSIEKWESGGALPTLPTLCAISHVLDVSLDALVYAASPQIDYYLGIDGGGTKTAFLLEDSLGNKVGKLTLGPSNPNDIGVDKSISILESGINELCRGIDRRRISLFAGVAGSMSPTNAEAFRGFYNTCGLGRFNLGSDLENARELALHGRDGVVLILGTGSIAYAQKNGECKRIGGWGYLLDNAGSGYDLGRDALNAALCAIDGTGDTTILGRLLEEKLGSSIPDAIPQIYAGGKRLIASFAVTLFEACDLGDDIALAILDRNMKRIAKILTVGSEYVRSDSAPFVAVGGLCGRQDLIGPALTKHLSLPNPLIFLREPMVKGAVALARKEVLPC